MNRKRCAILPMLLLVLWLSCTTDSQACSCTPEADAPACQLISRTAAVFLGRPLELVGESGYGQAKLYRFRIEKVYKGLAPDVSEVLVQPGAGTSCETSYTLGTRYLMFAGITSPEPLRLSAWVCSGSRTADKNQADLDFLDRYVQGKTTTEVSGKVLQWVTYIGLPREEESAPLAGAEVNLKNGTQHFTMQTDAGGSFKFSGIPAGEYELTAQLEPYVPGPPKKITVSPGGCQQVFVQLLANASIKGVLLTPDGIPAARQRVELLRKHQSGQWYHTSKMWAQTDAAGVFHFKELESGEYLLGHEIWGKNPSDYATYPVWYYPGAADRATATTLTLSPQQQLTGLPLLLPAAHTKRKITIRVVWPDGRPLGENLLQVFSQSGLIKNLLGLEHGATVIFEGYQEREYEFSARYWIDNLGGKNSVPLEEKRLALSDKVNLAPGKEPAEVVLVLKQKLQSKDEH